MSLSLSHTARRATAAAVVTAAVAGVASAAYASTLDNHPAGGPAATASAPQAAAHAPAGPIATTKTRPATTPATTPAARKKPGVRAHDGDVPKFDWANATLPLRSFDSRCPSGPVTFADGSAIAKNADGAVRYELTQYDTVLGDVNADRHRDAIMTIGCAPGGNSSFANIAVYAFDASSGSPRLLGTVVTPSVEAMPGVRMRGNNVVVRALAERGSGETKDFVLKYTPKGFQEITGKAAYLHDWTSTPLTMPFRADSAEVKGGSCKKVTTSFQNFDYTHRVGEQNVDGTVYNLAVKSFGDVNRDGVTDALVNIGCVTARGEIGSWLYAYTLKNGATKPLGFVTTEHGKDGFTHFTGGIKNGVITGKQNPGTSDITVVRTFRWTGHGFAGTPALPGFPNVDVAP